MTRDELLLRAKEAISSAEFLGFYETLPSDFWRLWTGTNLYDPESRAWALPALFYVGSLFSIPRLRTLKYTAALGAEEVGVLEKYNDLDMELWEWAVRTYRKDLVMYSSYSDFVAAGIFALFRLIVVVGAVLFCVRLALRRFRSRSVDVATDSYYALPMHSRSPGDHND